MSQVRLGIIGLGNMGNQHLKQLMAGEVPEMTVTAVSDRNPRRLESLPASVQSFHDPQRLIEADHVDAVLIATPHFDHVPLSEIVLKAGKHLLIEKPIAVHKADAARLLHAIEQRPRSEQVVAAMFNQRTDPRYQAVRRMLQAGELGELRRINWVITDWFRTDAYYQSGGWRATWRGEGGGVLLNQCPHQLDLLWWLFGSPKTVWAHCRFGQWHDIEVEDDVTALLIYDNGATGSFVTTTGEAPGTNRLEIVGELGHLIVDDQGLHWRRNQVNATEFCRTSENPFGKPDTDLVELPLTDRGLQHVGILQNFARCILQNEELLAPAAEGIHSVELANAMLLSTFAQRAVEVPIDGQEYWSHLEARIASSRYTGAVQADAAPAADMSQSF